MDVTSFPRSESTIQIFQLLVNFKISPLRQIHVKLLKSIFFFFHEYISYHRQGEKRSKYQAMVHPFWSYLEVVGLSKTSYRGNDLSKVIRVSYSDFDWLIWMATRATHKLTSCPNWYRYYGNLHILQEFVRTLYLCENEIKYKSCLKLYLLICIFVWADLVSDALVRHNMEGFWLILPRCYILQSKFVNSLYLIIFFQVRSRLNRFGMI